METFCIAATSPNALMKPIYNRMPVILVSYAYEGWLDGSGATELLEPFDAKRMRAYEVSSRVNSVKNNDEACLRPAE